MSDLRKGELRDGSRLEDGELRDEALSTLHAMNVRLSEKNEALDRQLQGAVKALRELADAVRVEGAEQDRALAIMRALTTADTIIGGQ